MSAADSDDDRLPDLHLRSAAADAVMTYNGIGLRGYAAAGGLDPASDFRGLDLRGWDLAGQDLRGFDLSACDLRGTSIANAIIDDTTRLDDARLDEDGRLDLCPDDIRLGQEELWQVWDWVRYLHEEGEHRLLATFGREVMPLLEAQFGAGHDQLLDISEWVASGESRDGVLITGLDRIDRVLAKRAEISPLDLESSLFARLIKAEALRNVGMYALAFEELNQFLPIFTEMKAARHQITLDIRYLRASVLQELGRSDEALAEIDALLPISTEVKGAHHHHTLDIRYLRVSMLQELGRSDEALAEVDALLPVETEVFGRPHWYPLTTRSLRAGLLIANDLGLTFETELRGIVRDLIKQVGSVNKHVLRARYRLARVLLAQGDHAAAREEIRAAIAGYEARGIDRSERWHRAARALLAAIDGNASGDALPA